MDASNPQSARKFGPIAHILNWLAGVDDETLLLCPQHDADCVRAIAILMIAVWCWQTAIFSLVAHRMVADDGSIHPELVLISGSVAGLILLIDSFMVMRSSWHLHGVEEIKRGGLDISGGRGPQIRNGIFLALRIFLSLGIAQLTAIFAGLILFHLDIVADQERLYQSQNASIIAVVSRQVDDDIKRAAAAVDTESGRVSALDAELAAMRQGSVDPSAIDPQMQADQAEVTRLSEEKSKRDNDLLSAQTFAANEMAGIKAEPGNSGKPGNGPVREGAQERVLAATSADETAGKALDAARARLAALSGQAASAGVAQTQRAQTQVPAIEDEFNKETAQLDALRAHLADVTKGREDAIRAGVEASPDHVGYDTGLLGQIASLKRVAQDPEIAFVIGLIDLTAFSLELGSVLAKITSFVPTTYSALLAKNAYMRAVELVNEMEAAMNGGRPPCEPEPEIVFMPGSGTAPQPESEPEPEPEPPQDDADGDISFSGGAISFGPATSDNGSGEAARRPRGRPRKNGMN